jgi:F420-dependent oxidoreductase-like protein
MRLGLNIGYSGASLGETLPLVRHAERVGVDSVWVAEAYGSDAVSVLGYLAASTTTIKLGSAIFQMPARTPACTAMTAMTLDALSGGRLLLGVGLSGPQVVEGWHGVPYGRPLARTREYIEILRKVFAREAPLAYGGSVYQIPYQGPDATGLGKPLKSILHPIRSEIPIYLAAIGPKNVALAGEIADGWLPIFYAPEHEGLFTGPLDEGLARAGRDRSAVDVAVEVPAALGDDVAACRDLLRPFFALYIGGMGAKGRNFYYDMAVRAGYEADAAKIQEHYLGGRRADAIAAVPDRLVDEFCLVGPAERIRDRLDAWKATRATTMLLSTRQPEAVELIAAALA